jgi:SNF2 family DNA or RNA helicase
MNFLLPTVFDSLERFQSWFDFDEKSLENSEGVMHVLQQEQEHSVITKLHEILRPFVLRRVKSEVLVDLPGKKEFIVYTQLQPLQEEYYTKLLKKELDVRNDTGGSLQNMLMQLRKVCNHPYLIQEPVDPVTGELVTDDRIISSCGKLTLLDRMLPRLLAEKHKILIFSQMRKVLDILDDYLVYKGLEGQYCRIDGMVPQDERQQQIDRFQEDPECVVFLLSTRAGGLGINWTAADTVIIYDSDWNPHQDSQAQDRCHRYGQKNEVRVYRFITPDTIEINMLARATSKRKLEEIVITEAKLDDRTHNKTIGSGTQLKTVSTKKSKLARALLSIFETSKDEDAKVPTSADPVVNDARKAQTGQESFSEQHMLTLLDRTPTGKDAAPAELLVVPGLFREVRAGASAIGGIQ